MNEKPGVEPMVETRLQIEQAPLVAPSLNFFDPAAVVSATRSFTNRNVSSEKPALPRRYLSPRLARR